MRFRAILAGGFMLASLAGFGAAQPAAAQPAGPSTTQADALNAYNHALGDFRSILAERRRQIDSHQELPDRPGQALYLARIEMMSTYKDLTDASPSRIGRANKFKIPPQYFDADNEPLVDEYRALFAIMEAPPAYAQSSPTPFKDVAELGTAIARAKGLDAADADVAGRISLGLFFAETSGTQNAGNARSNSYKGSFQTAPSEDRNGRKKWEALRPLVEAVNPRLIARDDKEERRASGIDHRYNHWTAVRDGLMNAHAELFRQIPAIVKTLPNPIDQMKFFELIQIIPTPARSALQSGDLLGYRISSPRIMKYLRNNGIFALGHAERAKTSASIREIFNAMWLFNIKFEQAQRKFEEIRAEERRAATGHGRAEPR